MTGRTIPPRACLASSALLISIAVSTTALAEQTTTPNIPAAPHESSSLLHGAPLEAAATELPLPYDAWRGRGFAPPSPQPAVDTPPPLARPRQLPRRPFELTLALAAFLPSCGDGSIDARGCVSVKTGMGVDAALLYRVNPFFAVGAEAALSGFRSNNESGALSSRGGDARFFGIMGRVYFADDGGWDPYLALTLGAGTLGLRGSTEDVHSTTTGLGGRVAGGVDYVFTSHLRIGPSASFAHWLSFSERACGGSVCSDAPAAYGRLLGFATLGFRVTGSFGDVL